MTPPLRPLPRRTARGLALLAALLFTAGCDRPPLGGGTEVRLVNVGDAPLRDVTVHVTGASYPAGTIAPGDSATVRTEPTGETSVHVLRADALDTLFLDVYFERGYGGRVRAEVTADSVVHVRRDHRPLF